MCGGKFRVFVAVTGNFDGADKAVWLFKVGFIVDIRFERHQHRLQLWQGFCCQRLAQCGIFGYWNEFITAENGIEVQSRTACDNRQNAFFNKLRKKAVRFLLKMKDRKLAAYIAYIDEVIGDAAVFLQILSRA